MFSSQFDTIRPIMNSICLFVLLLLPAFAIGTEVPKQDLRLPAPYRID